MQDCDYIIDSLILKFIFFVDLDLVNLMLLVLQQGNLLTRSLPRLPNPIQDSQKCKKSKQTKFLNKILYLSYQMHIFHHLLVHMVLDLHFGYEDFNSNTKCLYYIHSINLHLN